MTTGFTHESQKALSIEWYTPKWMFDELGIDFDLDVCTKEGGIYWIPAKQHFHKEKDGLASEWKGRVWCNPPYGKETKVWLNKFCNHGNGIALVFARTDTQWFHETLSKVDAVNFIKGRVQFVDGDGVSNKGGSTCGSMLLAIGEENCKAISNIEGLFIKLK